jgi:hypothetical protein
LAYSIDTSYFMRAWTVWYPYECFEGVWQVLVSAAAHQRLFVVDRVRDELDKQVPDLVSLFDQYAGNWHTETTNNAILDDALKTLEEDLLAGKIIRENGYRAQNTKRYMDGADPVLVLHAQLYRHVVVSNELSDTETKKGPKIPDLCEVKGVRHATPAEFAQILEHKFGIVARPP